MTPFRFRDALAARSAVVYVNRFLPWSGSVSHPRRSSRRHIFDRL